VKHVVRPTHLFIPTQLYIPYTSTNCNVLQMMVVPGAYLTSYNLVNLLGLSESLGQDQDAACFQTISTSFNGVSYRWHI